MELTQIRVLAERIRRNVNQVIVGKEEIIDLLLIALLSSSHVLLEDVPGTGKTLLAKALAKTIHCSFRRIQFTPDLLPSDLTGINYYNQKSGEFEFRPGALFTNLLLADEINRATPRTQSSLLECMEERQVTIDGETRKLGRPFLVLATQNPVENQGTFPLPEAQLDRFMMKVKMGYPTLDEGAGILLRFKENNPIDDIAAVADADEIIDAQNSFSRTRVSQDIIMYILRIVERTRNHTDIVLGVSPRGSQALLKAVQVRAVLHGRDYVSPDDVKALVKPVFSHRIITGSAFRMKQNSNDLLLEQIVKEVQVPSEEQLLKGSVS